MIRPIFVDIDGTLTDKASHGGNPISERVEYIRSLIASGQPVVIWSGTGTDYARDFATKHGLEGALAIIGKPLLCVDDCATILPTKAPIVVVAPEKFFKEKQ